MNEEQKSQTETQNPYQQRFDAYSTRAQERHARRMAKQAAREARHAARAQRPRHDWTFEVKAGEQVYTFSWRWHRAEGDPLPTLDVTRTTDQPEPPAAE